MADKSIGELVAATGVTQTDLFVLEQSGTAKKLTGQILENWLVSFADGHGGIQSIAKLSTSGLSDTYRITMADTTTFDFVVTNGRSITGISKTSTSGLVDTYTIEYNDGTTDTFTVQNGEKGDKGDNAYIWIKYASANPTDAAVVSMGDVPDDWMGVYTGYDPEAPSDPSEYRWYRIRGDKGIQGDKGSPGETYTTSVTYGVSDSPAVYPVTWYESITSAPVVSGAYVWSRVQYLNSSNVVVNTAYSVSHIGQNGTGAGTVTSVTFGDTVYQDVAGNVTIPMPSSEDVGAVADPKTKAGGQFLQWDASAGQWVAATPTGSVTTVNGVGVTAGTTNIRLTAKDIGPYHARNLLDNSDFRNPVNQRGIVDGSIENAYFIDRWKLLNVGRVAFGHGYISIYADQGYDVYLRQYLSVAMEYPVTLSVLTSDDQRVATFLGPDRITYDDGVYLDVSAENYIDIFIPKLANMSIINVALYEGSYTAETLPEYQPKGYGVELLECKRYFQKYQDIGFTVRNNGQVSYMLPVEMRTTPTFSYGRKSIFTDSSTDVSGNYPDWEPTLYPSIIAMRNNVYNGYATLQFSDIELNADL